MQHQVCTIAPGLATLAPFLLAPTPVERCACGEALSLEMERDCGVCVDCQAEAAGVNHQVQQ